ncbi:TIGR03986 family type III CRISPR-associated RAMP protein [Leptolyngbya sp. AN03gr2]|uniref:TIGR03986 family type III CRISPR-associated RAMP protein n=1 Tax=unclassified Leptolyngbya TaxID=2650499 RepID=UPI003D3108EB
MVDRPILRRDRANASQRTSDVRNQNSSRHPNRSQPQRERNDRNSETGYFHNPYNFVPVLPRQSVEGELGDRRPFGHGSYLSNHWSGRICVNLTTSTPLLIPDASQAQKWQESDHKTYPIRLSKGQPYLPPTSIKGSLRAAYEAITNSRFSVFSSHDEELVYRMEPTPRIVPAIVTQRRSDGTLFLRVMRMAKLPCYKKYNENEIAPIDKGASEIARENRYPENRLPRHSEKIWIRLNGNRSKVVAFRLNEPEDKQNWYKGWACITGPNCNEKCYERIFFERNEEETYPITQADLDTWEKLITNYQEIHTNELAERQQEQPPRNAYNAYLGHEPGQTGWSRHIYTQGTHHLRHGTFCYAQIQQGKIMALLPVMVSRQFFKSTPESLLADSLKPSKKIDELSPADRVFGWVNQNGKGSYRGQLRIHSVQCCTKNAVESFTSNPKENPGLPLTILGEPKPQQSRFYVSSNANGEPLPDGTAKQEGYQSQNQGLRGRKIYPHHKAIAHNQDYWENAMNDRTSASINGYYQEYRRPQKEGNEQRDSQNRSIQAWVKPNTKFTFEIDVINVSDVELGALLWLLQLPDDHYHRLGGGKPLGFGSVQLAINWEKTDLRKGEQWRTYYESLIPSENPIPQDAKNCIQNFQDEVGRVYSEGAERNFEAVRFIKAFRQAAKGFDQPIHYPRIQPQPDPDGENFKWFTANEDDEKRSLPALWDEQGLPYFDPQ